MLQVLNISEDLSWSHDVTSCSPFCDGDKVLAWTPEYSPTSIDAALSVFCLVVSRPGTVVLMVWTQRLYGGWSDQHNVSPGLNCHPSRTSTDRRTVHWIFPDPGHMLVTLQLSQEHPDPQQQIQGEFLAKSHQATELLRYWTVYFAQSPHVIPSPLHYSHHGISSNLYLFYSHIFFIYIVFLIFIQVLLICNFTFLCAILRRL